MVSDATGTAAQERKPVYIAFKTFLTALETLEQGVPPVIDRYVWRTFSGSLQAQTLSAFKFLGLVDESGKSQPILQKVIDAKGEARKAVLRGILEEKYAEAIKLGESNASFQQLQELLRGSGVSGGTLEMAVRFFIDACKYAGPKCSPHWTVKRTRRVANKREPATPREMPVITPAIEGEKAAVPNGQGLHPMLQGLIKELPDPGSILDREKRESLEKYFGVVLDILYKKPANKDAT